MSERAIVTNAREIDARAAEWVERRYFGEWSAADQAALDAWLEESIVHRVAFVRLDTGWRRTERLAALRPSKSEPVEAAQMRRNWPALAGIAAALGIIAILGVTGSNYLTKPSERVYTTAVGGHEKVTFADGSQIELNTDTVLRARMTTKERIVWLDKGEAYFQVKHDPHNPFTVVASGRRVIDLGTKFLVLRDDSSLEVALMEGRVRFGAAGGQPKSSLLTPGDDVVATAESISVTRKSAQELTDKLTWRRGVVVFKDTTLAKAVRELDRYNSQKLVVADPAVARRMISGTIHTNDVEGFIRVVRDVLGLHVLNDGNEIVITR